ncbi:gastrula zinc finger protein XlCGF57.1 [Labrus bergylta]|uniref:gastrula zinc finger protein XlCGF57.1 n=1 Tax=Labrus bergylta TaxID=56723 RepID=UPI003314182F
MSKVKTLRSFVNQRLTAAAEEIFDLFEGTIAEYEEQLRRSKEENERQHKLLDAVYNPEVRLHRYEVQQLLSGEEEVPSEQQERSSSLDQEDPPEPPHIKEDREELWSSQEGEQLQEPEEADISTFVFTPVPVKREEDDEEEPQSSQLHEIQTEERRDTEHLKADAYGEDCRGPEPDGDFNPHSHLQPVIPDKTSHSDSEDNNSLWDWDKTFKTMSDIVYGPGTTSLHSSECATSFGQHEHPQENIEIKREVRLFSCSFCGKRYMRRAFLRKHLKCHSEENCFRCSICQKSFKLRGMLLAHMRIHTEEKPFSSSVGGTRFSVKSNLNSDLNTHTGGELHACSVCSGIHTGENCVCSVCGKKIKKYSLKRHMRIHTEEKRVTCSVCGKRFQEHGDLKRHLLIHKGEKAFSCSLCGKSFTLKGNLKRHLLVHTGEKPYGCSICGKRYAENKQLKCHLTVHTGENLFELQSL